MKKITSLLVCLLFCLSLSAGAQTLTRPEFVGKASDVIGGPTASHIMLETTATANGKRWLWQVAGGHLKGQVSNDDGTSPVSWVDILRSGDSITSVSFPQINFTGNVQNASGGYFNWGSTVGSSGYGIRDNAGTLEFKNNAGVWQSLALPAPTGGGWTRSGTTVQLTTGTDTVLVGNWNKVRASSVFSGADAGGRLTSSMTDLPSNGGTVDARSDDGSQTWGSDPFSGVTKRVTVDLPAGTITIVNNTVVPTNVTLRFSEGTCLSPNVNKTLTIQGSIIAPMSQIFCGSGRIILSSTHIKEAYPQWWGAKADGVTDDYGAIQAAWDSFVGAAALNTVQNTSAGIVKFPIGTYYIRTGLSSCHLTGCPGGGSIPVGTINSCITLSGDDRGQSVIRTDQNIDMIDMFSWSCPSVIEHLYLAASATTNAIRVRGNQTTIRHNWILSNIGVIIETTTAIATTGTIVVDNQCDATEIGGPGGCLVVTRTSGTDLSPNNIQIVNQHCYGGAWCLQTDHIWDSRVDGMTGNGPGTYFISLSGATRVAIVNATAVGANVNNQPNEDALEILSSTGVSVTNFIASSFPGPGVNVQNSSATFTNLNLNDNVQNAGTGLPYEVYSTNSDLTIKGGRLSNTTGNPSNAVAVVGSGPAGSYQLDGLLITGAKYAGTVILGAAGAGGLTRVNIVNNELRGVNSTGGATPTIDIGATNSLVVANNQISQTSIPTNWLRSSYAFSNNCIYSNTLDGGSISLNSTSFGTFTSGCFNGATQLAKGEFSTVNVAGTATMARVIMTGGSTPTANGFVALGFTTVGGLPAASGHSGQMIFVTDSTAIGAEGQACVGGGGVQALAFSNNGIWKCF